MNGQGPLYPAKCDKKDKFCSVKVWFLEKFLPQGRIEVTHTRGPGTEARQRREIYVSNEGWATEILGGEKTGGGLTGPRKRKAQDLLEVIEHESGY